MTTYNQLSENIGLDTNDAALSVAFRPTTGTTGIVRKARGGFAVVEVDGKYARLNKLLPTLERARSYNLACAR